MSVRVAQLERSILTWLCVHFFGIGFIGWFGGWRVAAGYWLATIGFQHASNALASLEKYLAKQSRDFRDRGVLIDDADEGSAT